MDVHAVRSAPVESDVLSVLRDDGSADPAVDPGLSSDRVASLYEHMIATRIVGDRLGALSAEGAIGFFPVKLGSEAAVIGAASALRESAWIFPTHGDYGAALLRGMSLATLVARAMGGKSDPLEGRDTPAGLSARAQRIGSVSAPAATQLPHAVGFAYAARYRGEPIVTAAFFDASDIAAADFHTGLNFAGVMRTPTVFVCRTREGEESAADRAIEYGIAGRRCDGSDLLAVIRVVGEAVDRASSGDGATVIDLAISGDAMSRTRAHLDRLGAWSDEKDRAVRKRVEDELAAAIAAQRSAGPPSIETIHEHVFARPTPILEAQRRELLRAPRPVFPIDRR